MTLTVESLADAMQNSPGVDYAALFPAVNQCLLECGCTTVERAAMWFGQVGEESGGLRWMEEIASGAEYEGRGDLGNTQPGDGRRFKGRGPIQVTGRHNYTVLSQWAFDQGLVPTPTFFVDQPEQLASDQYGFIGVTWYWTTQRPMNDAADARDIVRATKYVNGGTNGLADRTQRWQHALAMGDAILPNPDGVAIIERPNFREINLIGERAISNNSQNRHGTTIDCFLGHTVEGDLGGLNLVAFMESHEVSYHYVIDLDEDGNTVYDCVDTDLASWSVLDANNRSINYVIARSFAAWTRDEWIEKARNAIRVMAYLKVQDARKYGQAQAARVAARPYSIDPPVYSDHYYVTSYLGIGTHTDMGPNYPFDLEESDINYFLHGDDMPTINTHSYSMYRTNDDPIGPGTEVEYQTNGMLHEQRVEQLAKDGVPWELSLVKRIAEGDPSMPAVAAGQPGIQERAKAILAKVNA